MHFALMLMLALAQAHSQYGKDTKGADATTHDKPAVAEPEGRGSVSGAPATASDTSDKAQSLSPVDRTELQGGDTAKKTPAKSAKKAKKSAKSMPEATPPSTPGNEMERDDTAKPAKKAPKNKEPNMHNEDQNPDNKSPNGQH